MGITITVFSDVDTPSPCFSTTIVSPAKEDLAPGWAMDDVYPPLAELRRALLTDEEWATMSSWEKDVWEMFYRPDWERLACIEQILVDTPAAQRAQRHEEILEALRSLGASTSVPIDHIDESHGVSVDAALSAIAEEGPEDIHSASTGVITTTDATCSTVCVPRHPAAAHVLVASSPPTPIEYSFDTNSIPTEAVSLAMSHPIASKVHVHRPLPWPSFMDVHANGEEIRPLPWPFFRFSVTTGSISTSTGYIITHNMCVPSELRCLDGVPLCLEYWWSTGYYVQSVHTIIWPLYFMTVFPAWVIVRSNELRLFSHAYATIGVLPISLEDGNIAALSYETDRYCLSSEVKDSLNLNLLRISSNYVLYDEWLLPLGNSGPQVNTSCYQLYRANWYTSCSPGNIITGSQLQVTAACSAMHLVLSGFSSSFCLVVMPELQLPRIGSQYVYLKKVHTDRSEPEAATLNSISINGNRCRLKWYDSSLAYSVNMVMYCSSFSCTCEGMCILVVGFLILKGVRIKSEMIEWDISAHSTHVIITVLRSPDSTACSIIGTMGLRYKGFLGVYAPIQAGRFSYFTCAAVYSQKNGLYMLVCGLLFLQNQEGVHSWVGSDNGVYSGHVWLPRAFGLMSLIYEQLLPTWPPPTAYCSLTSNMFSYLDVLILAICEAWLLNHQEMMQMLIGWPPGYHAKFITNKLSYKDNESHCFLCWYHGLSALFLFLAFDRQAVFQGGRSAIVSIIRYLTYDSYVDNLDYLDSDGLKVLQVPGNPSVCNVALYVAYQEVPLHIPWDPGRLRASMFYGYGLGSSRVSRREGCQGPFLYIGMGLGLGDAGAGAIGLGPLIGNNRNYKYHAYRNMEIILTDHGGNGSTFPVPCFSDPLLASLFFPNPS